MIFQHSTELAIRAALYLAQQAPGKLTPVREIAEEIGVSETYLAKIAHRLVSAGLVRSFRGPGKGMEIGRAPEKITLLLLVNAVQGSLGHDQCVLGLALCNSDEPCALHAEWLPLRDAIFGILEKTTLADLVGSVGHSVPVRSVLAAAQERSEPR